MNTRITSYKDAGKDIRVIRDTVFGEEQKVPRELDWDCNDPCCIHVVATDNQGNAIGTGRLQPDGRIGRLAVLRQWRWKGVGAKMLNSLVEAAGHRGLEKVYLHAQLQAIPFYEKNGFKKDGKEFTEAGIGHISMTRYIKCANAGRKPYLK